VDWDAFLCDFVGQVDWEWVLVVWCGDLVWPSDDVQFFVWVYDCYSLLLVAVVDVTWPSVHPEVVDCIDRTSTYLGRL